MSCQRRVPFIALAPEGAQGFAGIDRTGFRACGTPLVDGRCPSCDGRDDAHRLAEQIDKTDREFAATAAAWEAFSIELATQLLAAIKDKNRGQ